MFTTIAEALDLNSTFFIQFLIFIVMYPLLSRLLIGPYFNLHLLREKRTKNLMQEAEKWQEKQESLKKKYIEKAQQMDKEFQQIFLQKSRQINEEFLQRKQAEMEKIYKEKADQLEHLNSELQEIKNQSVKQIKPLAEQAFHRLTS